jgi:molecular chaperone GrpE
MEKDMSNLEEMQVDNEKELQNNNNIEQEEQVNTDKQSNDIDEESVENTSSEDELTKLNDKIQQLEVELDEKENRILRVQADYDNYRKRTKSEIDSIKKYQSQTLATELLTSLDNFERALQTNVTSEDGKALLQGVEMVYRNILEVFKNEGIEPIEAVGKEFNPHEHHAVMQGQDNQYESNVVIEELQRGYKLKDRVIRPAMVKVNE